MKTILFAAGLLLAAGSASAQDNVVKVNIFSPLVKTGSFFFEHKLNESSSLQLGALFTSYTTPEDVQLRGFALTPEYRFYLSSTKEAMEGFYVGPFVRYQNLTLTAPDNAGSGGGEASFNTFGGGILIGHQWIFRERFSLDAFLGPSYNKGDVKVKDNSGNSETFDPGPFAGFGIRTGVTLGIAF